MVDSELPVERVAREGFKPIRPEREVPVVVNFTPPPAGTVRPIQEQVEAARTRSTRNSQIRAQQVAEIRRELSRNNNTLELLKPVTTVDIQLTIKELTEPLQKKAEEILAKLTTQIERELRRVVPKPFLALHRTNPETFVPYPGFEYTTSSYFGRIKVRLHPDVPHVFQDPTEMDILRNRCKHLLFSFDKQVEQYHLALQKRTKQEVHYAVRLRNVRVVDDLLTAGLPVYVAYLKTQL